jgi:sugar phosphate isomerase/epimerase
VVFFDGSIATMRLGYSTWSMASVRAEEAIPVLAGVGYDSVEIAVALGWRDSLELLTPERRRRIPKLLHEFDLALPAIAGNAQLLADEPDEFADAWRRLTGTVDLAVEWAGRDGPPLVDTYLGGQPGDLATKYDLAVERLTALCDHAAARGVTIALQPHMDGALDTPEKVPPLLAAVGRANLVVALDVNDFTVQGFASEACVELLAPHLRLCQVKDERGRQPSYQFLVPGEGEFDYVRYLRELARAGYDGDVCAEVSLRVQRQRGFDPFRAAEQAYRALASAFAVAGVARKR